MLWNAKMSTPKQIMKYNCIIKLIKFVAYHKSKRNPKFLQSVKFVHQNLIGLMKLMISVYLDLKQ